MMQIPALVVCVVGFVVLLARGKKEVPGKTWALLGLGLALGVSLVMPILQNIAQYSFRSGSDAAMRAQTFSILALLSSLLRAVSYAFMLVALLVRPPVTPPPLRTYVDD